MKSIVCFGDSNTWGYDPATNGRFGPELRWTGVLARELGSGYRVIEEGLNARTTNIDDPILPHRDGRAYLPPCLESHAPFDLVTIMLGTNDLKARFNRSASDIAESAGNLANIARQTLFGPGGKSPKVLLMCPPPLAKLTDAAEMFTSGAEKSQRLAHYYEKRATRFGVGFLDAGSVITTSDIDGIHFEVAQHAKLGNAVAAKIREMLEV